MQAAGESSDLAAVRQEFDEVSAQVKAMLDSRFQEAIDEAAMRLGDVGADDYLMGWRRSDWESREGSADEVVAQCVAELEEAWSVSRIAEFLDGLG